MSFRFSLYSSKALVELLTASRFAIVGAVATSVHLTIVWTAISEFAANPIKANIAAFLVALLVSFTGHYYWTFSSCQNPFRALLRFMLLASAALIFNTVLLSAILASSKFEPEVAAATAALLIPVFTYICSRLWVFS